MHGLIRLRAAVALARRRDPCSGPGRTRVGQQGQHVPNGAFLAGRFWQRQVRPDVVPVAAAVLSLTT